MTAVSPGSRAVAAPIAGADADYGTAFAAQDPGFRAEFLADLQRESPFQRRFPRGIAVLRYDPSVYDMRRFVGDSLAAAGLCDRAELAARADRLEHLHELVAAEHQVMDGSQQSAAARALYEMPQGFAELYERLLAEVVVPQLGLGPAHVQRTPTFRVFFPHAPGYPGPTSYHTDLQIGHNPREVNVFVPLVPCEGTRSLLFADLPASLDLLRAHGWDLGAFAQAARTDAACIARLEQVCRPLQVDLGDVVVFDSRCVHAGPHNRTELTRVTFDVRLLPAADHAGQRNVYRGLGRRRACFLPGQYFTEYTLPRSADGRTTAAD